MRQADIVWTRNCAWTIAGRAHPASGFSRLQLFGRLFHPFQRDRKPFDDPRVRQALALTIDKERIVKKSRGPENNRVAYRAGWHGALHFA